MTGGTQLSDDLLDVPATHPQWSLKVDLDHTEMSSAVQRKKIRRKSWRARKGSPEVLIKKYSFRIQSAKLASRATVYVQNWAELDTNCVSLGADRGDRCYPSYGCRDGNIQPATADTRGGADTVNIDPRLACNSV